MNGNNFISLIGRLGQEPDRKTFDNGGSVVNLRLATNDNYRNASGELVERTQWHNVKAFGKAGDTIHQYSRRGDQLAVVGTLRYRDYTDASGQSKISAEVHLNTFTFLSNKRDNDDRQSRPVQQTNSSLGPVQKLTEAPMLVGDDGGSDLPF